MRRVTVPLHLDVEAAGSNYSTESSSTEEGPGTRDAPAAGATAGPWHQMQSLLLYLSASGPGY